MGILVIVMLYFPEKLENELQKLADKAVRPDGGEPWHFLGGDSAFRRGIRRRERVGRKLCGQHGLKTLSLAGEIVELADAPGTTQRPRGFQVF